MPADDKSKEKDVKDNKSEGNSDSEVKKLVQEKSEELLKKGEEFLEKSKDKLGELLDEKNRDEIKKVAQEKKDDLLKKGEKLIDQSRGILSKSKNFYEKSKDKLEKFLDEEEEEANELDGKENKPESKKVHDETVDEIKSQGNSDKKSEETSGKQPDSESEVEGNFKHKTVKEGSERKDVLKEFLNFKSSFTNSYGLLGGLIFLTVLIPFGWIEFVIDAPSFCRVFILPFPIMLFAVGYFIGVRFSLKEKKNRNWEGGAQNKPHEPAVPRKIKLSLIVTFISLISLSLIYWPVSESGQGEENTINVKTNGSKAYYEISVTHEGYDSVFQTSIMRHIHKVSTSVDDDIKTLDLTVNWTNSNPLKVNNLYGEKGGKFTIEGIRLSTPRKFSRSDYASAESMMNENEKVYEFGWLGIKFYLNLNRVLTTPMPISEMQYLSGWI